jgi:replicative DNA helicase
MPPAALLDRQLARLSGIDLQTIRRRKVTPDLMGRVEVGLAALGGVSNRLAFGRPPFGVENVAQSADAFGAYLVVLDYIQRFAPPGGRADKKAAVDAVMEHAHGFADAGVAVIVVAAVGRQWDAQGKAGYGGLNLASFRESSELEYGADDAFILSREDPDDPAAALLKHVKSRNGEPMDIPLRFNGAVQRFDTDTGPEPGSLAASVRGVWGESAHGEGSEW